MSVINAILPWFGGKRTLAPRIVEGLGPHRLYYEPFCGSMAVLMAKPPSRLELVNDLHGDLVNLARVIASRRWAELAERADRTLFCDELYSELQAVVNASEAPVAPALDQVGDAHLDRAWAYLAVSWMGLNGVSGSDRQDFCLAKRWTANGGTPTTRWASVRGSIGAWHERLMGVQILQRDAFELLAKIPDDDAAVIYADPPYLAETRTHHRYRHDFETSEDLFESDDHARMAEALRRFERTRVVVSYYDHPRLTQLYPGWMVQPVTVAKNLSNTGNGGGGGRANEVLVMNNGAKADA